MARMVRVAEGIYKRNGSYAVPIWNPRGGPKGKGGKDWYTARTLTEARAVKRDEEARKGRRGRGVDETCDSFAKRWARDYAEGRGETTRVHNAERVGAFARDFAGRRLGSVSRQEARLWVVGGVAPDSLVHVAAEWDGSQKTPDGVVVPSHRGNHKAVQSMFTDAMNDRLVEDNPFRQLRLKAQRGRSDIVVLSAAELADLIGVASEEHGSYGAVFGSMIEFAAWTGLRPGELYGLWWEDIDLEDGVVRVRRQWVTKAGRYEEPGKKRRHQRDVTLLPRARRALERLPKPPEGSDASELGGELGHVFFTKTYKRFTGRVHHYYWDPVRRAFWNRLPAARKQEIPADFDFYELRHFFGTELGNQPGITPQDIALEMGHADGGKLALERYVHVTPERARDRVRAAFAWQEVDERKAGAG